MTSKQKVFTWVAIGAMVFGIVALAVRMITTGSLRALLSPVSLAGAVLRQDDDPGKQTPLANVKVTALDKDSVTASGKSTSSGFFNLTIRPPVYRGRFITLRFQHPEYQPLEITVTLPAPKLFIARMQPLAPEPLNKLDTAKASAKIIRIKDAKVRYLLKNHTTINVGTLAKQFLAPNIANVPCQKHGLCSPDEKWKATATILPIDADQGNEFQNVRVSCIAGPCPFTSVEPDDMARPARKMNITVVNWSDTADFLVEADVTRTTATDTVRYSYPFIVSQTMNFALPSASEGPSIEANFDGQAIVCPLGPDLILSWATCSVEVPTGGNKIYRCELKPGYEYEQ
jgi:hypothetical protein